MKRKLCVLCLCFGVVLAGCSPAGEESPPQSASPSQMQPVDASAPVPSTPSPDPELENLTGAVSAYFPSGEIEVGTQGGNTIVSVQDSSSNLDASNSEQWSAWKDAAVSASLEAPIRDTAATVVYLTSETGDILLTAAGGSILYDASEQEAEDEDANSEPYSLSYVGTGDDVIQISGLDATWAMHITGNDESRHFSVTTYDENMNYLDLLVNTSEPYEGVVIDPTQTAANLEIKATGSWKVELIYLRNVSEANAGTLLTGTGDAVIMTDRLGSTLEITGNSQTRHFAVKAYNIATGDSDLLVNTTEEYAGTVLLDFDPTYLVVNAVGAWTIQF